MHDHMHIKQKRRVRSSAYDHMHEERKPLLAVKRRAGLTPDDRKILKSFGKRGDSGTGKASPIGLRRYGR